MKDNSGQHKTQHLRTIDFFCPGLNLFKAPTSKECHRLVFVCLTIKVADIIE